MSVECQVNDKSQSELDIGERETCYNTGQFSPFRVESNLVSRSESEGSSQDEL